MIRKMSSESVSPNLILSKFGNVPSGGRIGNVTDNFISFPAKDAVGGFDENASPHLANHLVGSMLMRIYPDLFPNVASITEFWRDFRTVEALLK